MVGNGFGLAYVNSIYSYRFLRKRFNIHGEIMFKYLYSENIVWRLNNDDKHEEFKEIIKTGFQGLLFIWIWLRVVVFFGDR